MRRQPASEWRNHLRILDSGRNASPGEPSATRGTCSPMRKMRYVGDDPALFNKTALVMHRRHCLGTVHPVGRGEMVAQFDDISTGKGGGWWPHHEREFEDLTNSSD